MYTDFMQGISKKHNIDYDFQPIQQLAKYHLLIKRALNEIEKSGKDVEALRAAEEDFKKVMEKIYDTRYESNLKRQPSFYTIAI
jgi:hypothetical protein